MARPVVTLYGRPGCHLCEDARRHLDSLAARLSFDVAEVNIETDDRLLERYVFAIPVVAVGEREIARAPISVLALEDTLRQALA